MTMKMRIVKRTMMKKMKTKKTMALTLVYLALQRRVRVEQSRWKTRWVPSEQVDSCIISGSTLLFFDITSTIAILPLI